MNEVCKHSSVAPAAFMATLPANQGGPGRHRCCICAYQAGLAFPVASLEKHELYECPHGNAAPAKVLSNLLESQGGVVRHRCAACAFTRGIASQTKTNKALEVAVVAPPESNLTTTGFDKAGSQAPSFDSETAAILGFLGEDLVLQWEAKKLREAGQEKLAADVRHASLLDGDHLGYDIRSFDDDGKERFIEVKTTMRGHRHPFHVSINQLRTSEKLGTAYNLYRLFDFNPERRSAGLYKLSGGLEQQLAMTATSYLALPK